MKKKIITTPQKKQTSNAEKEKKSKIIQKKIRVVTAYLLDKNVKSNYKQTVH